MADYAKIILPLPCALTEFNQTNFGLVEYTSSYAFILKYPFFMDSKNSGYSPPLTRVLLRKLLEPPLVDWLKIELVLIS
ncbi:TPA: hypothetical protein ACPDJG_000532 [Pasteurella multocida]